MFCTVLHDTGGRVSEVLALTPKQIDFNAQAIVFETLKKRRKGIYRAVPVPSDTLMVHGLDEALKSIKRGIQNKPLWLWSRMTAWRKVLAVMDGSCFAGSDRHLCQRLGRGTAQYRRQNVGDNAGFCTHSKWLLIAICAVKAGIWT